MRALPAPDRKRLESAVLAARRAAEHSCRDAIDGLGVFADRRPDHLDAEQAVLRNGLRARWRQLGLDPNLLVAECAYEQWHRLLFARFLAENDLLLHPQYEASVTLADCEDLAAEMGEPDAWSVAARFASEILPGIFRLDDPCVRLRLAPEGRHALEGILDGLGREVFAADDALGWVYQFWQKDKKDEINASERKIGGADLGPVTQLFTENYMVRFLLENSLGAWWAERHPGSPLVEGFEYLRFDDNGKPAAGTFDSWPERVADVTVMDPCCGSGHFVVEAFSMLWQMRMEEEDLSLVDAQDAVLRCNLFGLEIDPRCVQIARFAVCLIAWKAGGAWRPLPSLAISCTGFSVKLPARAWEALGSGSEQLKVTLTRLYTAFKHADSLGSLIRPITESGLNYGPQSSLDDIDWDVSAPVLAEIYDGDGDAGAVKKLLNEGLSELLRAATLLAKSFTLTATNVPFLSRFKQGIELRDYLEVHRPSAKGDLAVAMLHRWLDASATVAVVSPQNWQENPGYSVFRRQLLASRECDLFARIGNNVWQTQSGRQPFKLPTLLSILSSPTPVATHEIKAIDIGNGPVAGKPLLLTTMDLIATRQQDQVKNPDSRITLVASPVGVHLEEFASAKQGIKTGDDFRYRRMFWEVPLPSDLWSCLQSSVVESQFYSGRSMVVRWENGRGDLSFSSGARIQGREAWGRKGVIVSQMGDLPVTLYTGEIFDSNAAAVIPRRESDLSALWAFLSSSEYRSAVRQIDNNVKVTNRTLTKVSFDVERWRKTAADTDSVPSASSNDPTQWLFGGRVRCSDTPLHVAVGRLLGYRWPEQPESDGLDAFTDNDGIVCIPAVAGEARAADRVHQILASSYGELWSPAKLNELLRRAGSSNKNLADWLRDEFFKQHCALFHNRPFVWHIWDGLKDGFSALVNYHMLDRKTLAKFTYSYLGQDWVERQRAEIRDDVAGAEARLRAAQELKRKLELILEGEAPHGIYVRWKAPHEQAIGWEPDLNDGVRLNIRPFVTAGVLRFMPNIKWGKDRGKNPDGSERPNDVYPTLAEKLEARNQVAKT